MGITDELREWMRAHQVLVCGLTELFNIVDRIDAEHEKAIDVMWEDAKSHLSDESLTEDGWVRLPKDADSVPIHVGDVMDKGKVTCIRDCGKGWEVVLDNLYTYDVSSLHHYTPTVEDVLREFGDWYAHTEGGCDEDGIVERFAAKLRLADDGGEQ